MGKVYTTRLWLDKIYRETMDLLEEAKHYHAYKFKRQVRHLVPVKRLEITKESLRVTSRLSHTMAWLMAEKAIINEELLRAEFEKSIKPLSEEDTCVQPPDIPIDDCPNGLISLMDRSFDLFMRATRLEAMLRNKAQHYNLQPRH